MAFSMSSKNLNFLSFYFIRCFYSFQALIFLNNYVLVEAKRSSLVTLKAE